MTSNGRSSSKSKDDGSNGLKKTVVIGIGSAATGSGAGDSYSLRSSVRDSSSNKQLSASPQNTRRSQRFVKSASVSPVSNRKSGRRSKELTPSPLRRSDRGKKQISSGSSGSKKSEKVSVAVDLDQMKTKREKSLSELTLEGNKCEDMKSGRGKKQAYDGRTFKALFKRQLNIKATADRNGINSSERDGTVKETAANAEKLVVDCSREEQVQTPEVAGSELIKKSHDDGIDNEHGDSTTHSKRKMDFVVDLDASAIDGRQDVCTSSSDSLHSSSGCKTPSVFKRCAACSKRQRFCDGRECKTSCNLSCLNRLTDDATARVWHCFQCLNSKMHAAACSLPRSVEAIWNSREAEVSDTGGLRKDKQYFVKYRGLAHIHNQWIPESQLLLEAEGLIQELNRKREVVKWNEEWVVPQRLLKKRLLLSPRQENSVAAEVSSSNCEWLVKWRGLDYNNVTWELDTFLDSVNGQNLIKEFENRHKKALDDSSSVDKHKNGHVVNLQKLPAGSPPGLDISHLDTLNKLREFRRKGQSAVVFDDQDRIMKTLLYIVSLSDVCQPFLIVTTSSLLPVWESEFLRVAPSIDVVVYDGSIDNRKSIRTLEFYEDGGRIMPQVLLSSVDVVVEDLLFLETMKWEAVIVDECQQSKISSQFEQIKMLVADVKILLYRGPLKDNVTEYINLLSLLDSCGIDVPKAEPSDNLCKFKERLSLYIACECKSSSSKFVEFWVPSMISNVQLEQYCDTLLSNSISLCLNSKTDPVGALRDTVFSTRKSCDHPYIVDPSLKILITKDLPPINFLDVEIKASGKLQLLDMILSEIKKQQLRVLILFQSVAGSGRDTLGLGDILDDFLRERFGEDTYERVDGVAISSKLRQKALNGFNKGSGRFVFLLENRACLSSIRLVSVDTIIIFDSDWNPANDVKALNKISIDSQSKQIKIFRLYSAFTVEERVLILAKQGLALESNLENISRATNTLLMWGASYLLNRLDEFHSTPDANVSSEQTLARKVVDEILALLSQNGECDGIDNYSISKIQQRGGIYSSNLKLLGEQQVMLPDGEHPHLFWANLLNGRNPKWKFLSGQTQRHRKKVQYFNDSPKQAECEAVEVGKKRKKGGADFSPGLEQHKAEGDKIAGASGIPEDHGLSCLEAQDASATDLLHPRSAPAIVSEKRMLSDTQKNFHLFVKPSILKLCDILKLSDEVKNMAERFLEYVISNHQVSSDSKNILQAFLISLCWSSASLLNQKVDRKGSLFLAQQHLNFICNEKEADSVYSALRKLKKAFKENVLLDFSKDNISGIGKSHQGTLNEMLQLQHVKPELEETRDQVCIGDIVQDDKSHKANKENSFKLTQKKCRKQIAKLKQKQDEEIKEFNRSWEVQRLEIENKQKVESTIIKEMYSHTALRMDKLKTLGNECAKKLEELERQKEMCFKQLKAQHLDALSDENRKVNQWLKSATPFVIEVACQNVLPLHPSGVHNEVGCSRAGEYGSPNVSENVATLSRLPDLFAGEINLVELVPGNTCVTVPSQTSKDDEVEMALVDVPVARSKQPSMLGSSTDVYENTGSFSQCHSENQNPEQNLSSGPGGTVLSEPLKRIPEKVIGDANSLELETAAVEFLGGNDRVRGVSAETPNVFENHSQSGEANSSVNVDSSSTEMLKFPEKQPASSPACNQVEVSALQVFGAEKVSHVQQPLSLSGRSPTDLPLASGSAPRSTNERDNSPRSRSVNAIALLSQASLLASQIAEENHPVDNRVRHLADEQHEIPQQLVGHTTELPNRVLPHLGANVELHIPTDVIETPLRQNQPDLPSTSGTLDHQPLNLGTYVLNSEAVPQVNESTIELPRQAVIPTRVNMSVQGFNDLRLRAEHQVPSRIPKLTSYSDPLQNQLEGIRKETEQAIKLHEDTKMRLKFELEESIAQLRRNYEAKCKDAEAAFQWKKKELDKNHIKVLVNKILADAFRSKCVEPSKYMGTQQGVHPGLVQHVNQLPSQDAPRSSPVTVTSSAGQPAASQQNTALRLQPTSRLHPNTVSSMARQPASNQQNTVLLSQYGTRLLPVTASSSGSQPAATQLHTTLLTQPEPGNNFVSVSSSAGQPSTYQQNTEPLLPTSPRIPPISLSSSGAHSASSQQSTQPPLQIVHQSAALFPSIATRPPQINPITPSMGNVRVGNENRARAPAPHLQAFRSASSVNHTSTQRAMPSHLTPTSLPAYIPPNYFSADYNNSSPQSNTTKDMLPPGSSNPTSASVSSQELLKARKQLGAQRLDEPLPDLGSALDSIDLSVFESGPSLPRSSAAPDVTTNLVCLSDED